MTPVAAQPKSAGSSANCSQSASARAITDALALPSWAVPRRWRRGLGNEARSVLVRAVFLGVVSFLQSLRPMRNEEFDETLSKADASERIDELRERSPRLAHE